MCRVHLCAFIAMAAGPACNVSASSAQQGSDWPKIESRVRKSNGRTGGDQRSQGDFQWHVY
jgi:hypothetical protein